MNLIKIAKIVTTRGIKGEVKVKSLTNMQEERFKVGNSLYILENEEYRSLKISSYRVIKNNDILTFEGYDNINEVTKFVGHDLYSDENQDIVLSHNEFFIEDLIGLKIYQFNQFKGVVKDVITYPQGDYLVIETNSGDKFVPFRDEFIENQDDEQIILIDMEGLL
ncbi:MAG: ribosome maturation factor RimM [Candidatus Izemoplasmatales bacterium]